MREEPYYITIPDQLRSRSKGKFAFLELSDNTVLPLCFNQTHNMWMGPKETLINKATVTGITETAEYTAQLTVEDLDPPQQYRSLEPVRGAGLRAYYFTTTNIVNASGFTETLNIVAEMFTYGGLGDNTGVLLSEINQIGISDGQQFILESGPIEGNFFDVDRVSVVPGEPAFIGAYPNIWAWTAGGNALTISQLSLFLAYGYRVF